MSVPVHRNTDGRSCGAKTTVTGQSNVFANSLLVSVQGDLNTHGEGALGATVNGGTVFVNGKKMVLQGSASGHDSKSHRLFGRRPHINPRATGGSPDVFAS